MKPTPKNLAYFLTGEVCAAYSLHVHERLLRSCLAPLSRRVERALYAVHYFTRRRT